MVEDIAFYITFNEDTLIPLFFTFPIIAPTAL